MDSKKNDTKTFKWTIRIIVLLLTLILINHWFKCVTAITLDSYSLAILLLILGMVLLRFVDKIKIGSLLEIERLKEKIDKVELTQYLAEVIKTPKGDIYYYDKEGKHKIPDQQTAQFLMTQKGEILVSDEVVNEMQTAETFDSVMSAEKIQWGDAIFVILNGKKYYVSSMSYLADWGTLKDAEKRRKVDNDEIKKYKTGR
jgi:hypothetical protein